MCTAQAAAAASVPVSVHLDHAHSPEAVRAATEMNTWVREEGGTGGEERRCFDSIMIDMSHYPHDENLRLTGELARYCHERGIVVEAESGRIEGEEDGVSDTADLE